MLLSVVERLVISQSLPMQGAHGFLHRVADLAKALDFTRDEVKAMSLHVNRETGNWEFDTTAAKDADVELSDEQRVTLGEVLKGQSDQKTLSMHLLRVYDLLADLPGMTTIEDRVAALEKKIAGLGRGPLSLVKEG